ncbi:hypothetical protein C7S13_4789 [Burkholderia cepacia]|nr:hypothetical protein [Burkholderia cepacia]
MNTEILTPSFPDLDRVAGRITDTILYPADQPTPGAANL